MKDTGKMIYSMDMERKYGLITLSMKENTMKVKSMVKELMYGQMVACMKETGLRTVLKVTVPIHG